MNINTCEKNDVENLTLEKPLKTEDLYISNINFTLQTPKLKINKISKKITLILNENMEKLLNNFDNKIIELLSQNSSDFFEEELSIDDSEEIYKNSYKHTKLESKINLSINKKITIFNKYKEILDINNLCSGDEVICLIKCKKIIFYKNHCEPHWEVFQIKLKEQQLKKNEYLFIEDENDNYIDKSNNEQDDIYSANKIKIKE